MLTCPDGDNNIAGHRGTSEEVYTLDPEKSISADHGRVQLLFRSQRAGETVWEHIAPADRGHRYVYDYCPQTAALSRPNEVAVTPLKELRIEPDQPL